MRSTSEAASRLNPKMPKTSNDQPASVILRSRLKSAQKKNMRYCEYDEESDSCKEELSDGYNIVIHEIFLH